MRVLHLTKVWTFRLMVIFSVGLCFSGSPASANLLTFEANLDGLQEVPPNASPAFGLADFILDDVSGALTVSNATYQDLLGGATAVTLNGAAFPGFNASIIMVLTLDTPGAATGTFSGGGTLVASNITAMINTQTYVNIRSQVFPGGEIRGQLFIIPEPSTVALVGVGVVGLFVARRRKK